MADTSLIFNIIAKDSGLGRALSAVQRGFRSAGQEAEDSLAKAGAGTENLDRMIAETQAHVRSLAEEFERTGDKTLFGKISRDRSLITNLQRTRAALEDAGGGADDAGDASGRLDGILGRLWSSAQGLGSAVSGMGSQFGGAVTNVWSLLTVAFELSAAMAVAAPAIYAVGGAAAALPALLSGAIAALFTLKLGLSGLSENWAAMNKPAGGGGGGGSAAVADLTPKLRAVEAAQRQVARSTRDITDAQADLKDATEAVNKARVDERERIDDVRRSLASARADEEDSVQSLAEAQMALSLAQARGNPDEIRRAQIAVDKQAASVEEAKDKTQDLQKESDDAAKAGVEGSAAVVAAKKREKEAQQRVQDAVEAHKLAIQQLGDAQDSLKAKTAGAAGAAGGLAAVVPKIAASAKDFLDELKRLKPAFDDLRLEIQQKLFAGLADKLKTLAERWLPALHKGLGDMADTINGVVKTAFDSLSDPKFITNMMIGVDAFRGALGKIGDAIAGPLVDAWGRLSAAAAPFVEMLGDRIAGLITEFSDWIKKIDESGELADFMATATHVGNSLFDIFTDLARITGDVIQILFGTQAGSTDAWDNLALAVHHIAEYMGNPENQHRISQFMNVFGSAVFWVGDLLAVLDSLYHTGQGIVDWAQGAYTAVHDFFVNLPTMIAGFFTWLGDTLAALPGQIGAWLASLPDTLWNVFSAGVTNMAYLIGWGIGQVGRFLSALPGQVATWLRNLPEAIATAIGNAVVWFATMGPRAYNAMINVTVWVGRAIGGLAATMWNAGYNAVIGLWNGIAAMGPWLFSRVQNLAIDAWNAFMRGMGAHSPSRKFAEAGRWAVLGAAMGVDDNAGVLMASAATLAANLAATRLTLPGVDGTALDAQLTAAADGTVTVQAANRKRNQVTVVLDVKGTDSQMKKLIQGMARTANLNQSAA